MGGSGHRQYRGLGERNGERYLHFLRQGAVPVFLLVDKRSDKQVISADIYALAESEPYPNPLPRRSCGIPTLPKS